MVREHEYYCLLQQAINNEFAANGYLTDFQITGHPPRTNIPERFLRNDRTLLNQRRGLLTPDIMGLVWRTDGQDKKLVTVEFKQAPTLRDVFQAKGQQELFGAEFSYLVGACPLSESTKSGSAMDFIRANPGLLKSKNGEGEVIVRFLHKTPEGAITLGILGSELELVGPEIF